MTSCYLVGAANQIKPITPSPVIETASLFGTSCMTSACDRHLCFVSWAVALHYMHGLCMLQGIAIDTILFAMQHQISAVCRLRN